MPGVAGFGDLRRRPAPGAAPEASTSARLPSGDRAHRDQPDGCHGVRQRLRRLLGDDVHRAPSSSRAEPVQCVLGGEHLTNETAPQRCLDEVGPLGEETRGAGAAHVAVQLGCRHHAGRSLGERNVQPSGGGQAASSGRSVDVLRQCGLGDLGQSGERSRVADRDLGEVLAVHLDTCGLEALDQPVVGDAVGAGRRVDPRDPQLAELTLAGAPVAVGVGQRMQLLLFGLAVEPGPLAAVALRGLEDGTPLLLGVECALHACHGGVPILVRSVRGAALSAVEHLLHAAGVVGSHRGTAVEATGALARLVLQEVPSCWPSGARSCRFR